MTVTMERRRRTAWIGAMAMALALASGCMTRGGGAAGGQTAVETLAKGAASWDGARLPAYPEGQPEVTVLKITIPPGTALPLHRHPVINAGVLLAGELTVVREDGRTLHLAAGDALIELVNTWHYGKNEGREPAVIVVFYAGTEGAPVSVYPPAAPH